MNRRDLIKRVFGTMAGAAVAAMVSERVTAAPPSTATLETVQMPDGWMPGAATNIETGVTTPAGAPLPPASLNLWSEPILTRTVVEGHTHISRSFGRFDPSGTQQFYFLPSAHGTMLTLTLPNEESPEAMWECETELPSFLSEPL